ncbi:chemotaxis protein CheW [Crocosphaera chwakensis]|uniref:Chemotaxis signal transduction protein n=1 Tax=Crocosphaera chwakensis CCY0110 TaxID=391612 RepID=A3IYC6_9CHRO|nr:chemotaxis protein CheW [Crocosphaera chwakensis]EAZ88534.1 Chemotaxis signal transduction protein [Crocosphaera chwakensis CCY0110]
MKTKPYLIFNLHDIQYGIEANLVKEIFQLPELIPIAEAPTDIVGILNLREKLLPVMHLDLRLSNSITRCQLTDSIIVLNWDNLQIGVIVNTVHEVIEIEPEIIEQEIDYGRTNNINPAFISGIATIDDSAIILLNPEALVRQPDEVKALVEEADSELEENPEKEENLSIISSFYEVCCPDATEKEKSIFRRRADNLRQATLETSQETTEQIPLAVVSLNNEYFGLGLETVREFINICNFTPIPCCPQHILGNINLRGEIVTLVDLRSCLNLPITSAKNNGKAVVIEVDDLVAGLPVDEVFDVMYLSQKNINPVPIAVESGNHEYLRGTAPYADKLLSILDLSKIINQGNLEVNDAA